MGVRVREEMNQVLRLNNTSHDQKKQHLENLGANTNQKYVDGQKMPDGTGENTFVPTNKQMDYPLLQPIQFTNQIVDDYMESGVWCLK